MITQQEIATLTISNRRSQSVLKVSDITHLRASSNYTFIHHKEKRVLASKTLGHFQILLGDSSFVRTHHSCIVNAAHIDMIDYKNREITLKNGKVIPIARSRKSFVRSRLQKCHIVAVDERHSDNNNFAI